MSTDARLDPPKSMPVRARAEALGFAALVALLLLTVALALPRAIGPGDAGELGTIMLRGGVPHPPGYPWMRLLGLPARALWAVGVPPAMAAALPCALCSAAGWALLARTIRRLCAWPVAYATVAVIASAHVIVLHTIECEVFGPLVLAAALMLWLAVVRPLGPVGTGVCLGAAVATHLTAIGLLPLAVAAAWPQQPGAAPLARAAARGLLGSAVGLSVFATLLLGEGPWRWGAIDTLAGLVDHVLRRDYGTFDLSLHDASPGVAAQVDFTLARHADAWTAGLSDHAAIAAAIAIAVALGVRAAWPGAQRRAAIALGVSWLLVGPGFASLGDLDPGSPFAAWILERFSVLPLVLATPALAVALGLVIAKVPAGWPRLAAAALAIVAPVRALGETLTRGTAADETAIERYALDLLHSPEPGVPAIVLGTDDHRTFGVLWAQQVLGAAPQVIYIDASLLQQRWYRARLRPLLPPALVELAEVDKPVALLGALWQHEAGRAMPVYLANDFSIPSTSLPRVPQGALWRVLAPWEQGLGPEQVLARHLAARARLLGPPPQVHSPFAGDLAASYAAIEDKLARALAAAGRRDLLEQLQAAGAAAP